MDKLKICTIFEYEFLRANTAAQTTRNINDVYGPNTARIYTVHYWFKRFKSGNFELKNEPRGRPVNIVDNDELKAIVEADPTQSTAELAVALEVEYDAYRSELEASGGNPPELLLSNIERHRRHYERLRDDSAVKLKLLHENRVKVMNKQLLLFHNAVSAYFSGNNVALEAAVRHFNIHPPPAPPAPAAPSPQLSAALSAAAAPPAQ